MEFIDVMETTRNLSKEAIDSNKSDGPLRVEIISIFKWKSQPDTTNNRMFMFS